ncbi:MAG TPA: hypothetical protein VGL64_01650 [Amycolatopsis sp.]
MNRVIRAWALAATVSGLPSTVHALLTRRDPLAATRAAGTLLPGGRASVLGGAVAHVVVSAGWTAALAGLDRRRPLSVADGLAAGAVIAALDLGLAARRYPAIRALPQWPQWLDHLAYGALTAASLKAARDAEPEPASPRRTGTSAARSRRARGAGGPGRRRRV